MLALFVKLRFCPNNRLVSVNYYRLRLSHSTGVLWTADSLSVCIDFIFRTGNHSLVWHFHPYIRLTWYNGTSFEVGLLPFWLHLDFWNGWRSLLRTSILVVKIFFIFLQWSSPYQWEDACCVCIFKLLFVWRIVSCLAYPNACNDSGGCWDLVVLFC